jgi:hypothetical protein
MRIFIAGVILLALALPAVASEKPDFSGTWIISQPAMPEGEKIVWSIQQNGEEIQLTQSKPVSAGKTEVACSTRGKECSATIDGEASKVTFWYNGAMLVEMRVTGDNGERVIKTRRKLSADGKTMNVEVIQISPPKDPQQLVFVRAEQQQAAR